MGSGFLIQRHFFIKIFEKIFNPFPESGPVIGLALEGDDMIKKWRTAIGNTKVSRVKYSSPEALRHDFGVSGTLLKIKK